MKMGISENILRLSMEYSRMYFFGSFFLFFTFLSNNILRAKGNTKTPMKILIIAGIINMILDPMFIFGFGFIPSMGIQGASFATVLSRFLASIYLIKIMFLKKNGITFKAFRFDFDIVKNIFKIGIPATLNQVFVSVTLAIMNFLLASNGEMALAAFGVMMRIESFVFMPLSGLVAGVITMVGQNFGAKRYHRIDDIVKESTKIGVMFILLVSLIILIFGKQILGIFSDDVGVVSMGYSFFKISLLGYIALPFVFTSGGAMQGMGNGFYSLIIQTIKMFVLTIPLAILFIKILNLEINFIMLSFLISNITAFFISITWYFKSNWRKKYFGLEDN